ncbi:1-hydroxy-2-methyl-2-butenyl 4-diphosphate reductase [Streptomyces tateyamensis]|uniref:1-hydroxy-2-methyl-2-butenyl 4-diphosphate reductase n=1 Tax=Streptomyces tateyamensis TaxID=565073 RepID=A0A2V4PAH2_9ACTN|nr:1-hydroxy-2-methyl-2-butenyl 4-diphosphate reductase [Streptomyces tateyamensis]PYC88089.1 1-hydroxy-2-methyl-2-butenyl 4-diphosphate reductase [Streptomyces tateyamensis]
MNRPLLVLCALAPEEWALRGGDWANALGGPAVLARTGMGAQRTGRSVSGLLSVGDRPYSAVLLTGFCAATVPGTRPGEVIVADKVQSVSGCSTATRSPEVLAGALRGLGLPVRVGALYTADRVVRGRERQELHRAGFAAVDMETAAALAHLPDGLPVAAVRVVVDTPEHELLRPGTLPGGLRAFRTLRATVPALMGWHRAVSREVQPPLTPPTLPTLPQEAS